LKTSTAKNKSKSTRQRYIWTTFLLGISGITSGTYFWSGYNVDTTEVRKTDHSEFRFIQNSSTVEPISNKAKGSTPLSPDRLSKNSAVELERLRSEAAAHFEQKLKQRL